MGFDIASVHAVDTVKVDLEHPGTRKPLGASIIVAGFAHPKTLEAKRLGLDRLAREVESMGRRKKKDDNDAGQRLEEASLEALILRTVAFEGIEEQGEPIPCTPENVRKLYTDPLTRWIADQVQEALGDREEFFK